ncbi:MAG: hypothetical protein ACE5HT_01470 [Gemmatimonadales bacterium]
MLRYNSVLSNVSRGIGFAAFVVVTLGIAAGDCLAQAATTLSLEGAWEPQLYLLKDGTRHELRGRMFFTGSEWLVTFFVMDGDAPKRGSSEGGTYVLRGDSLILRHRYLLAAGETMAGLAASPLQMEARVADEPVEGTSFELSRRRLVLHFPSGNAMEFRRPTSFR